MNCYPIFLVKIVALMFLNCSDLNSQNLISVRDMFYRASKSSVSADSLFEEFSKQEISQSAIMVGYKGMSQLMICYHSLNPYTKYRYFLKGKKSLEEAIKIDPKNVELRFLRLSVQLNTPDFLNYNSNIMEDKILIYKGVKFLKDKDLLERIAGYTANAKKLSMDEKSKFKNAIEVNKYVSVN